MSILDLLSWRVRARAWRTVVVTGELHHSKDSTMRYVQRSIKPDWPARPELKARCALIRVFLDPLLQ